MSWPRGGVNGGSNKLVIVCAFHMLLDLNTMAAAVVVTPQEAHRRSSRHRVDPKLFPQMKLNSYGNKVNKHPHTLVMIYPYELLLVSILFGIVVICTLKYGYDDSIDVLNVSPGQLQKGTARSR